jgi:hypothetical protein
MVRLGAADLRGIVDVGTELAAAADLAAFRDRVSPLVRRLVPADLASYNAIDPGTGTAVAVIDPPDAMFDGAAEALGRYAMQNPLIARYARTGDPRTLKFSDFVTRRQLHRLDIYRALYAVTEIEHQVAFALPDARGLVVGVSLSRRHHDFSERDRGVLDLLRPALVQAYRAVRDRATLAAVLGAAARVGGGPARTGDGLVRRPRRLALGRALRAGRPGAPARARARLAVGA